ncbi:hypothetical protein ACGFMM_22655 [Streptomyces sp. NPDC048604]|uniref:hypothetical protein n=1 Tax=Streptomyces sp. NPDC048604 TaxID=3365578 RepID=UPI00371B6022
MILSVPVVALVAWALVLAFPVERGSGLPPLPAVPLADRALPGGGVGQLSKCRREDGPRPPAKGLGEKGKDPLLGFGGWSSEDPGPKQPGRTTFSVHLTVHAGKAPLLLPAPLARGGVTIDVYGPHGEGRRASARGLSARAKDPKDTERTLPEPRSGVYRVAPGGVLYVEVELPAGAVCPGHGLMSVGSCSPDGSNDITDCPILAVTFSDPAIRAYRAAVTGEPGDRVSDRLVAVSFEPERAET